MLYVIVIRANNAVKIASKCFRSMKKNEPPHSLEVSSSMADGSLSGRCSCVAGSGGYCHHVIGLLYYLALLKQLGHRTLPDDLNRRTATWNLFVNYIISSVMHAF